MGGRRGCRVAVGIGLVALAVGLGLGPPASAATVSWVDWTSASPGSPGSAAGSATTGSSTVSVTYTGEFFSANTAGGTNWWATSSSTYTKPPEVENPPPDSDIIRLVGGSGIIHTIGFSSPVVDPVMAMLSIGQSALPVSYAFDAPFEILNVGPGYWGSGTLVELAGDVLEGREGHGLIRFGGTFTSLSWTVPSPENWHGFTFGFVSVPEPGAAPLLLLGLAGLATARRGR